VIGSFITDVYRREQFFPSFMGLLVNPFYMARKGLMIGLTSQLSQLSGKLLYVGCGKKPYKKLCTGVSEYIGLEIDTPVNRDKKQADYFYDGKSFPFLSDQFDSIFTSQVLEHVFNPKEFLSEINRVLKTNGKIVVTVPFVWDEHEQPYDFARYSSFGLKSLLEEHGFEIIDHKKSGTGFETIAQLLNAYIYKVSVRHSKLLMAIFQLTLMAPINCIGLILSKILPRNEDLYLDNIILAEKVRNV